MPIDMEDNLDRADVLLTTKQFFRKMPKLLKNAEDDRQVHFRSEKELPASDTGVSHGPLP